MPWSTRFLHWFQFQLLYFFKKSPYSFLSPGFYITHFYFCKFCICFTCKSFKSLNYLNQGISTRRWISSALEVFIYGIITTINGWYLFDFMIYDIPYRSSLESLSISLKKNYFNQKPQYVKNIHFSSYFDFSILRLW